MTDNHILRMTEQIGELNGSVKSLTDTMIRYADSNERMHNQHIGCCNETKVEIGKINSRHSTYWKIIASGGGLGAMIAAFLKSVGGN